MFPTAFAFSAQVHHVFLIHRTQPCFCCHSLLLTGNQQSWLPTRHHASVTAKCVMYKILLPNVVCSSPFPSFFPQRRVPLSCFLLLSFLTCVAVGAFVFAICMCSTYRYYSVFKPYLSAACDRCVPFCLHTAPSLSFFSIFVLISLHLPCDDAGIYSMSERKNGGGSGRHRNSAVLQASLLGPHTHSWFLDVGILRPFDVCVLRPAQVMIDVEETF